MTISRSDTVILMSFLAKRTDARGRWLDLDAAGEFNDGYAVVVQKGQKLLIDAKGKIKKNLSQSETQAINQQHRSSGRRR